MTDLIAGLLMASGGSSMLVGGLMLARGCGCDLGELVAALPFTPVPPPDRGLDDLVASID